MHFLLLYNIKHAGKLLIEIGPTFFVTIYLCKFLCYWRQIFYMNRYVHGEGNYHFGFLVWLFLAGKWRHEYRVKINILDFDTFYNSCWKTKLTQGQNWRDN